MARPSPITIVLGALLGAILCVAIGLLVWPRPGPRPEAAATVPESDERTRATPPVGPHPAAPPPLTAPRAAPAAIATATPPAPSPSAADAGALPGIPFDVRRDVLTKTRNLRMAEADEEVFGALNLPEATRARIREINEEHRLRTERALDSTDPPPPRTGAALTSGEARQAALIRLLGSDGARQFDDQERAAVRKMRDKNRYQWGRQLRE